MVRNFCVRVPTFLRKTKKISQRTKYIKTRTKTRKSTDKFVERQIIFFLPVVYFFSTDKPNEKNEKREKNRHYQQTLTPSLCCVGKVRASIIETSVCIYDAEFSECKCDIKREREIKNMSMAALNVKISMKYECLYDFFGLKIEFPFKSMSIHRNTQQYRETSG